MSFDDHNYRPRLGNSSTKVTQSLNSEVTGHLKYSPTRSLFEIPTPMSISLISGNSDLIQANIEYGSSPCL